MRFRRNNVPGLLQEAQLVSKLTPEAQVFPFVPEKPMVAVTLQKMEQQDMPNRIAKLTLCTGLILAVCLWGIARAQGLQSKPVFFSQGQAIHDPNNIATSRDKALRDFKAQAVTQAIVGLIGPDEVSRRYSEIQKQILSRLDRYVEAYQIFSQDSVEGLFRILGRVTVNIAALENDLSQLGVFALADSDRPPASEGQEGPPTRGKEASVDSQGIIEPARRSARGQSERTSQQDLRVLWLVSEKWDQKQAWHLPQENNLEMESHGLLARSVLEEAQDHNWNIVLLGPDDSRNLPELDANGQANLDRAMSIASQRQDDFLATGTGTLQRQGQKQPILVADLQVYDVQSHDKLGEIHRELRLVKTDNPVASQEGIIELAAFLMPELDRVLRSRQMAGDSVGAIEGRIPTAKEAQPDAAQAQRSASSGSKPAGSPDEPGRSDWTVIIRPFRSFAEWEQLEQTLRRDFKELRVSAMELRGGEARIRLDGVGPNLPNLLQGMKLAKHTVQILEQDLDGHKILIALNPL
jgi:hypothetical protein